MEHPQHVRQWVLENTFKRRSESRQGVAPYGLRNHGARLCRSTVLYSSIVFYNHHRRDSLDSVGWQQTPSSVIAPEAIVRSRACDISIKSSNSLRSAVSDQRLASLRMLGRVCVLGRWPSAGRSVKLLGAPLPPTSHLTRLQSFFRVWYSSIL